MKEFETIIRFIDLFDSYNKEYPYVLDMLKKIRDGAPFDEFDKFDVDGALEFLGMLHNLLFKPVLNVVTAVDISEHVGGIEYWRVKPASDLETGDVIVNTEMGRYGMVSIDALKAGDSLLINADTGETQICETARLGFDVAAYFEETGLLNDRLVNYLNTEINFNDDDTDGE